MTKWRTEITALDRETGEEINQRLVKTGEYIIVHKTSKRRKENDLKYVREVIWHCEKSRQIEIFE